MSNSENIHTLIQRKRESFICIVGYQPDNLYLGLKEYFMLEKEVPEITKYIKSENPSKEDEMFYQYYDGMKIFRVHNKSHLAVS